MIALPKPTDDLSFFEEIKTLSNQHWAEFEINPNIYGFQIQKCSQWRKGLSDEQILNFEKGLGFKLPIPLRNFYAVMNGLNKPGININSNPGSNEIYKPIFYSFSDDLELIKKLIDQVLESFNLQKGYMEANNISRIFPVCGHRFMLIDEPGHPILSIAENDVIYWSDNISKLLVTEIFSDIYNPWDFESNPQNSGSIKFWLD